MYNPNTIKEDSIKAWALIKNVLGMAVLIIICTVLISFTIQGVKTTYNRVTKERAQVYKTPITKVKATSITLYEESEIRCVNYSDNTKQCREY